MSKVVPTAAQFFAEEGDVGPEDISQRVSGVRFPRRLALINSLFADCSSITFFYVEGCGAPG